MRIESPFQQWYRQTAKLCISVVVPCFFLADVGDSAVFAADGFLHIAVHPCFPDRCRKHAHKLLSRLVVVVLLIGNARTAALSLAFFSSNNIYLAVVVHPLLTVHLLLEMSSVRVQAQRDPHSRHRQLAQACPRRRSFSSSSPWFCSRDGCFSQHEQRWHSPQFDLLF